MTELLIIGFLIVAALFVAMRWGRSKEREKQSAGKAETRKKMLDAAVNAPKDKRGLIDRLRDGGL